MSWKELYSEARIKSGIVPKVKDDYYKIMSEAVKTSVNADDQVKDALLIFLKPFAFSEYKSVDGYRWAAILVPMFIQWLAEGRKKKVSMKDLNLPSITPEDAAFFAGEYSDSEFVQSHVKAALIKFGKFITSRYPLAIKAYPFGGLKVDMPRVKRIIVYNKSMLDDFYNVVLGDAEPYYLLLFRLLLQTGLRPLHGYYLTCGDIEYDKPQQDALGRAFYPIFARKVLDREKRKVKETVFKKLPPEVVYISESLKNDIVKWCRDKGLTGTGYVFKDFVQLDAAVELIRRRRERPTIIPRLQNKDTRFILYGLRDTWTSVVYALTRDPKDLIDLGGWASTNIPLTVYSVSMKSCAALEIAIQWEIYLPEDKKDELLEVQGRCGRGEAEPVPGAPPVITQEALNNILDTIEALQKKIAKLEKR